MNRLVILGSTSVTGSHHPFLPSLPHSPPAPAAGVTSPPVPSPSQQLFIFFSSSNNLGCNLIWTTVNWWVCVWQHSCYHFCYCPYGQDPGRFSSLEFAELSQAVLPQSHTELSDLEDLGASYWLLILKGSFVLFRSGGFASSQIPTFISYVYNKMCVRSSHHKSYHFWVPSVN